MMQPPFLKKGDTVAIVSTARKITLEDLKPAIQILESWELKVKLGDQLFSVYQQFAGTDQERTADFQKALNDDSIKAVICARGGYGTVRIIDHIDFNHYSRFPKWIVGYSDVTVLHSHIQANIGVSTIHGSMPVNFEKNTPAALGSLKKALFGEKLEYDIPASQLNRKGECEGVLTGGNLSIIYSIAGSVSDVDTKGKILFLEDLDEYLYHVDRMMQNLKRSGKLSHLAGLVVGGMTDMKDNAVSFGKTSEEIVYEAVDEYDYPVCFNFPTGHFSDNRALYFNKKARLTVGESVSLAF